ncbi:hypothetical protein L1987_65970 [Smallanthus sonchifolius]|uniref:Uncharacterized protein n=1 Tax=Smallanthus sonchifolius TaxID=185202 RepID=A0ACB9BW64_9ASTR|nr:hypothetical protein L1987_65970 [Smallanthus sonchifolius]
MLTFRLPFFYLLLLLAATTTTTIAQAYNATEHFFLDCGSSSSNTINGRTWDGDENSKFVPSNFITTSFSSKPNSEDPPVPETPYSSARIFSASSFTYTFPVSEGPKFLRLHFYPATYAGRNQDQSYFSVSSNGYSLLTNFSAFLASSFLEKIRKDAGFSALPNFVKEFIIYVKDTQSVNVTFTPSPNSYAFINGIEIVSMPQNLYFNSKDPKSVGMTNGPVVTNHMALENIYRLKMGGRSIPANEDTTGMYRSWEKDDSYIYGAAIGLTPVYQKPIPYTTETPNYTAPEEVYQNQRSMGKLSDSYNLTWILPVDSGPVVIPVLPKEQVSLAGWGKYCHRKGTMSEIIDPKLTSVIAPECLKQFGEVAVSCLKEHGVERPSMEEVVWGLEFALNLQEDAETTVGEPMSENQEPRFLMEGETMTTTTDDDVFSGSSGIRYGTSSISSSNDGFKSETVFSEILKPAGR